MTLESAQMLSTAMRIHGYTGEKVYSITHKNHPSNIWVRETRSNYEWLLAHFKALAEEYHRRRGKWHKSFRELFTSLSQGAMLIPEGKLTPMPNCAANKEKGVSFKHIDDTCTAYQLYLNERWEGDKREPTWD
jgi:hypothetical protein